jgi:hypothetical protein
MAFLFLLSCLFSLFVNSNGLWYLESIVLGGGGGGHIFPVLVYVVVV